MVNNTNRTFNNSIRVNEKLALKRSNLNSFFFGWKRKCYHKQRMRDKKLVFKFRMVFRVSERRLFRFVQKRNFCACNIGELTNQFSNIFNNFSFLVAILLSVIAKLSSCDDASARSLDLSWRPLSHSPYQQQFFQGNQSPALISYAHFDHANKDEIVEAAKHNAQMLKQLKEIAHQPITSYSDPYQVFSQTPGPLNNKYLATTAFLNHNLIRHQQQQQAASNQILSRIPYSSKSAPLYQTKLNFLGKPDSNAVYIHNSIHQTIPTTPKVAGYTKEHGRLNFHYHHPSYGMASLPTTTKKVPMFR